MTSLTKHRTPYKPRLDEGGIRTHKALHAALAPRQAKRVASEHYVDALTDYREIDPQPALARLFA